jgi:GT2 family glycosyltransferase
MENVSIYIPVFNVERTIKEVLNSVITQTIKFDEIIVINDYSNDQTLNILNKFKNIKIINNKKNMGLSYCRNLGLKSSKNKFVASIDGDVVLDKNWLEIVLTKLKQNIAMCGGNMVEKNLENKFNKWRSVYYSQNWGDKNMQNPPFLFGCNTIQKKDVWNEVGGYDENFKTNGEDIDFCAKLRDKGFGTYYLSQAKCYHLQNDDSKSLSQRIWRYHSYGYKIKKPSFFRFIKLIIKQFKIFFLRSFANLLKLNFTFICINFYVLINFIKLEFRNINNKD